MKRPKDFGFGEDETMLRKTAIRFLAEHSPPETLRKLVAADSDPNRAPASVWNEEAWQKAVELGWTAVAVPEDAGGVGMATVGVVGLVEAAGRFAFPSPLLSTLFGTYALRAAGDAGRPYLVRIAEGATCALAITNAAGSWSPADTDVTAEEGKLSGTACFVQDVAKVDFYVVSASADGGTGLYIVEKGAPGASFELDQIVDLTRDQGRLILADVEAICVAEPGAGSEALAAALPYVHVLLAADIAGVAAWQLDTTVEYAKTRKQFDRTLGFFQAVKHPLVDVMLAIDETRSLAYDAAAALDHDPEDAPLLAHMAKARAATTAAFASNRSIQLHGGIGFTWEHDAHIFFKRNKHSELLFGDASYHRQKAMNLMAG